MNVYFVRSALGLCALVTVAGLSGCTSSAKNATSTTSRMSPTTVTSARSSAVTSDRSATGTAPATASRTTLSAVPGTAGKTTGGAENQTGVRSTCSYTTSAAVSAAFGSKISSETVTTSGTGNSLCRYTLAGSNLGVPGTVSLTLDTTGSAAEFAKVKQQYPGAVSVSGTGDSAFFSASNGVLQFIRSSKVVIIESSLRVPGGPSPDPAKVQADATTLARSIAQQL